MGLFNASTQQTGYVGNDLPQNRFVGPNNEAYFLQINPDTGETQVWNEEWGADKNVGTFDAQGNFVPNENWWGGARQEEIEFFNSPEGRLAVQNQAREVMKNEDGRVNQADPPRNLTAAEQNTTINNMAEANLQGISDADVQLNQEAQRNAELAKMGGEAIGRKSYGHYCYPITLRRGQQDRLKISVLKFKPKSINADGTGFADRNSRIVGSGPVNELTGMTTGMSRTRGGRVGLLGRTAIGSVTLPVNNVNDTNSTEWGGEKMNAGQLAVANAALVGLSEGIAKMTEEASGTVSALAQDEATKQALTEYFVEQATGVSGILARTSGSILNPNMELIFKGPQLRQFGFTYKFSARDNKETAEIKKIIRMFKQSMAVQRSESNLFLKAPNTYRLEYHSTGRDSSHRYLPKIKECALTKFDVNYTPNGTYMTYEDSSMVQYEVTFAFKELDPLYNSDYTDLDGDSDSSIGY